jgi:hypothetical protein
MILFAGILCIQDVQLQPVRLGKIVVVLMKWTAFELLSAAF